MGLFDYVYAPLKCRHCGYEEKEHEWQTKAIENILARFRVGDLIVLRDSFYGGEAIVFDGYIEIHTTCPKCKKSIEGWIKVENARLTDEIVYSDEAEEIRKIKENYEKELRSRAKGLDFSSERLNELLKLLKKR
jgi:phage FluMu protein Com